jgi:2'-5' RNA ligase
MPNKSDKEMKHDGIMVALPIPEAYQMVQDIKWPDGSDVQPPEEMHVTLGYMGDFPQMDTGKEHLFRTCEQFANTHPPIVGRINGAGIFFDTHLDGMECMWLSFDAGVLPDLRYELTHTLSANEFPIMSDHGFTPHITAAYFPKGKAPDTKSMMSKDVTVNKLRVAWGDEVHDYPFNDELSKPVMREKSGGFHVLKQADGSYRWVTISSSAFRDRDGEIVTQKALANDVEWCDTIKSYGPLRWWHVGGWEAPDGLESWKTWRSTPGIDLGECDFNMLHGRMLIESGTFKDATTGEAFSQCQDNLEVSIAFSHPKEEPGKNKQYQNIHRFERSLLPAGMASNLLTKFYVSKGNPDMKTTEKLAALMAILKGKPDLAQQILADAEGVQKAAEASGLEYKEVETLISGEPEQVTEEVIQPLAVEETGAVIPEVIPVVETAPVVEVVAEKAVTPPMATEPADIGDWTPEKLTAFVVQVVQQMSKSKEAESVAQLEPLQHTLKQATDAITALSGQVTTLTTQVTEQQQSLPGLTDSRPVGVKQMQMKRATERSDNVVAVAPTGPQIDPAFLKFLSGG